MTPESFDATLEVLVSRQPFRPFTIELNTGVRVEIDHPRATSWRPGFGSAIFRSPGGVPIYFDHDSVTQIIDAPSASAPGGKPKKKPPQP